MNRKALFHDSEGFFRERNQSSAKRGERDEKKIPDTLTLLDGQRVSQKFDTFLWCTLNAYREEKRMQLNH
jgi:hypothetical protein